MGELRSNRQQIFVECVPVLVTLIDARDAATDSNSNMPCLLRERKGAIKLNITQIIVTALNATKQTFGCHGGRQRGTLHPNR